jgi:hypothetical protein
MTSRRSYNRTPIGNSGAVRLGIETGLSAVTRAPLRRAAASHTYNRLCPIFPRGEPMRFGIRTVPIAASLAALVLAVGAAPAFAAFGAFAYNGATGKYGASWNQASEKQADETALKGCASEKCKIVFRTGAGQCGAIAATEDGKAWGGARRPKREEAEKAALANCEKRPGAAGRCKVKTAECNK